MQFFKIFFDSFNAKLLPFLLSQFTFLATMYATHLGHAPWTATGQFPDVVFTLAFTLFNLKVKYDARCDIQHFLAVGTLILEHPFINTVIN